MHNGIFIHLFLFYTSNAFLSASILEYLGVEGSFIIFLPSSMAVAVVSLGISSSLNISSF